MSAASKLATAATSAAIRTTTLLPPSTVISATDHRGLRDGTAYGRKERTPELVDYYLNENSKLRERQGNRERRGGAVRA